MLTVIFLGVSLTALIIGTVSLIYCIRLSIKVGSIEKSTHSIQYVSADKSTPLDKDGFEIVTDEVREKFKEELI